MDSFTRVVSFEKTFENITVLIGNLKAAPSALKAKARVFLLTHDIFSALLGSSPACLCEACQEIIRHVHVEDRRIFSDEQLVAMQSMELAALDGSTVISGVSFAGRVLGECIPSEV